MRRIERYCRALAPHAGHLLLSLARAAQALADSQLDTPEDDTDDNATTDS